MLTTFVRPTEGRVRLYLDSALRADWDEWLSTGLFYGVTTDPAMLAAAGIPCTVPALSDLVHATCEHGIHEVHLQTWGTTADAMVEHAVALAAINHRVVVTVPITRAGIAAVRRLRSREIKTGFSALVSAHQALTAAIVGVDYAAPSLAAIGGGADAHAETAAMQTILTGLDSTTRLLATGIAAPGDLARLAQSGIDAYACGADVARGLLAEPRTLAAAAAFETAARGLTHA